MQPADTEKALGAAALAQLGERTRAAIANPPGDIPGEDVDDDEDDDDENDEDDEEEDDAEDDEESTAPAERPAVPVTCGGTERRGDMRPRSAR